MTPVRVAVVGAGGIAQAVHLPLLQRNRDRAEIAALVDLSAHRRDVLGERYGIPEGSRFARVADLADAVRSGSLPLDAAILATSGLHCADAALLLGCGLAVLSEKPLAYSARELDELERAAARLGIDLAQRLRVGYMKEYDPAVAAAREHLVGSRVRAVTIEVLHPADGRQLDFARLLAPETDIAVDELRRLTRLFDAETRATAGDVPDDLRRIFSSVLLGSVVHDIALLRHLGLPLETVTHASWSGGGFPGSVTASGTTAGGMVPWQLGWHFIAEYPEYRETITVHHETGTTTLVFPTPYLLNAPTRLVTDSVAHPLGHVVTETTWPQAEAFERELYALLAMSAGVPTSGSSVAEARADLRVAEEFLHVLSASTGSTAHHHELSGSRSDGISPKGRNH